MATNKTYERILANMPPGLDRAVLRVLNNRQGKINIISGDSLKNIIRLSIPEADERQIRECIRRLRRQGFLIGSKPGETGGYWMCTSWQEFSEFAEAEFHSKIADMSETISAMQRAAKDQFGDAHQMRLV